MTSHASLAWFLVLDVQRDGWEVTEDPVDRYRRSQEIAVMIQYLEAKRQKRIKLRLQAQPLYKRGVRMMLQGFFFCCGISDVSWLSTRWSVELTCMYMTLANVRTHLFDVQRFSDGQETNERHADEVVGRHSLRCAHHDHHELTQAPLSCSRHEAWRHWHRRHSPVGSMLRNVVTRLWCLHARNVTMPHINYVLVVTSRGQPSVQSGLIGSRFKFPLYM